jgi:hypothetical protein
MHHRYFRWGDDTSVRVKIGDTKVDINADNAKSTGFIYRAVDGARGAYKGLLDSPYPIDNGDGTTVDGEWRYAGWDTNVPVNTEYVLQWGINSNSGRRVYLSINHLARDEWVRVAIPYPPGTTFHITDNWDNSRNVTRVMSAAELGPHKFFWDTNTNLLWLHLENDNLPEFSWYYNLAVWDGSYNVLVRAFCPSPSNCIQAPPAFSPAIIPPRPSYAARPSLCELNGGIPNANFRWNARMGSSEYVIFGDALSADWGSWSSNWDVVGFNTHASSAAAMRLNFTQWAQSYFYVKSEAGSSIRTDAYTHLELAVRTHDREGDTTLTIGAEQLESDGGLQTTTSLVSPYYTNEGLVTDQGYRVFRVPLTDLGVSPARNYLARFWISGTGRPMTLYVDSVKLVAYDVEAYEAPLWTRAPFNPPPPTATASTSTMSTLMMTIIMMLASFVLLL